VQNCVDLGGRRIIKKKKPEDLAAFSGVSAGPGESLPVPVIPKKC
jgi:hypothetical protein